jgi:uncharacterized membrane protein
MRRTQVTQTNDRVPTFTGLGENADGHTSRQLRTMQRNAECRRVESTLKIIAENVGLLLELAVVVVVLVGGARAILLLLSRAVHRGLCIQAVRRIWIDFAAAILIALEFALGADIVQTAIAPTWDDIGQLAAIAAIRTGLGFFLGRDIHEFASPEPTEAEPR